MKEQLMRIGIATWFEGNYGSVLQAFAISEVLKSMEHTPVFIRFNFGGGDISKLISRIGMLGLRQTFSRYVSNIQGSFALRPHRISLNTRADAMSSFVEMHLISTKRCYTRSNFEECLQEADVFLCGSDQIWNPANTCYSLFYWLAFVPEGIPKIAYAPSMGMPRMSESDKKFVVTKLNSFQDVSVRERATADMLNSLHGLTKHVETVVDPTLLVSKGRWESLCDESRASRESEPYAFAYILRGNPEQRDFCTKLARSRGLRLIVYPYLEAMPQGKNAESWGDERVFDDDPADFLARIRGASLVITDSFHCTLFSILFHRDFYVLRKTYDSTSQRTRIDEILAVAGLSDRVLEELEEPHVESDFAAAEARLAEHARSSREFLEGAVVRAERIASAGAPAQAAAVAGETASGERRGPVSC